MIKQHIQHTLCYSHTYIHTLFSPVINGKVSLLNTPSKNVSKDCREGKPCYWETILSDQLFACGILFSNQLLIPCKSGALIVVAEFIICKYRQNRHILLVGQLSRKWIINHFSQIVNSMVK